MFRVRVCTREVGGVILYKGNKIQQRHHSSQLCGEVKLLFRINSALPSRATSTLQAINPLTDSVEMALEVGALTL